MDIASLIPSALGLFGTGLSQHARLLTLASAQDSSLPQALVAERFAGREGINELYAFEVDALSTSTDLDLQQFIGEELTVTLLQADGSRRAWHGICTEAAWLGADGGTARYTCCWSPRWRCCGCAATAIFSRTRTRRTSSPNCWPTIRNCALNSTSRKRWRRARCAPSTAKATWNSSSACWPPRA